MPTPDDETFVLTPPIDIPTSRTTHTTSRCPPEDDRLHNAPREQRATEQLPLPESDSPEVGATEKQSEGTSTQSSAPSATESPATPVEALMHDLPSPASSPGDESKHEQSDTQLARATYPPPVYLEFPSDSNRQSDRQVYDVQVELKHVDMAESFLCGYLRIQGLTDDHPTLTTYFEAEVIGTKHTFRTTHPEWGSNEKVDMQHWARFPAWRPLAKAAKSSSFSMKNFAQREHIFMRWKEYFLVPDHRVKTINGASFEGFYYVCFNQCTGSVSGIYFHAKSEKYQQLELNHVEDRGCMGAMEFR
ncbi:hypothetical protein LTR50_004491 [Elasticomyces elasticus]|nr:hypothetical protein LTR50_004491 [Elasticomyces elasticus]